MENLQLFDFSDGKNGKLPVSKEERNLLLNELNLRLIGRIKEEGSIDVRNELILHNMRLIRKLVSKYKFPECKKKDLIQEGVFAIIDAAKEFDPAKGKFSTFAALKINQRILKKMHSYDESQHSLYGRNLKNSVQEASDKLCSKLGREPLSEEIDDFLGIKEAESLSCQLEMKFVSLNAPRSSNEGSLSLGNFVGNGDENPEQITVNRFEFEKACLTIRKVIEQLNRFGCIHGLSERKRIVFLVHYGLLDGTFKKKFCEVTGGLVNPPIKKGAVRKIIEDVWVLIETKYGIDKKAFEVVFEEGIGVLDDASEVLNSRTTGLSL